MESSPNPRSILDVIPIKVVPVWEKIFSYLPAQDLVTCSATAQAWRDALELERTSFFNMAEVFPILLSSGYFPEIQDYLNFRRVCRFWKIIIDRFFQNHPDYFPPLHVDIRGTMPSLLKKLLAGDLSDTFPSLSRSITYAENERSYWIQPWDTSNTSISRLRSDFTKLLERVGSQILHCDMTFLLQTMGAPRGGYERCPVDKDACQTDPETLYKLARSFLLLMPNLRTLSMIGGYIYCYDQDQHLMTPSMMKLMVEQPLPPLNNLVTMKLNHISNPLETGALQTYNHIGKLSIKCNGIGHGHEDPVIPDSLENLAMPHLDELEVDLHHPQDFVKLTTNPPWKLTSLTITFGIEELDTIFRTASHFGNTLRHLIIGTGLNVTNSEVQEELLMARLELPQLETCTIHCNPTYIYSIDFLLPCTKLRKLSLTSTIAAKDEHPVDLKTIIKFQGHFDKMYKSNIWTLLLKLEVFELTMKPDFNEDPNWYVSHAYDETIHTYTRREYLVK